MIRIILLIAFYLAAIAAANNFNPGPGDADIRGPAQTVEAWPWEQP